MTIDTENEQLSYLLDNLKEKEKIVKNAVELLDYLYFNTMAIAKGNPIKNEEEIEKLELNYKKYLTLKRAFTKLYDELEEI